MFRLLICCVDVQLIEDQYPLNQQIRPIRIWDSTNPLNATVDDNCLFQNPMDLLNSTVNDSCLLQNSTASESSDGFLQEKMNPTNLTNLHY